ncbi:ParB/RepB/Spo0J family partition protein [Streptomyces sp. NPDC006668]|uniref:ParB/RepB/Spo0J family partition protein n=1 Tax=Streptomyces sp. NPDC006668 TaxID=3156903 RepID=UPI0033CFA456
MSVSTSAARTLSSFRSSEGSLATTFSRSLGSYGAVMALPYLPLGALEQQQTLTCRLLSADNKQRSPLPGVTQARTDVPPDPYNPRATLAAIEEMADSLTGKGVIQPLTVVTMGAFLAAHPEHVSDLVEADCVVVDGNRRLAGAKLAGLDDVPVHVDDPLAGDADTLPGDHAHRGRPTRGPRTARRTTSPAAPGRSARLSAGSRPVARQVQRMGHPETCSPQPDPRAQANRLREDDSPGCRPAQSDSCLQSSSTAPPKRALNRRAAKNWERTKGTELTQPPRANGAPRQTAEAAKEQSAHATVDSDSELQALAQDLRSRLTPEQVEN